MTHRHTLGTTTTAEDGLTVRKQVDHEEGVATVRLDLSVRSAPRLVRIVEQLPDGVGADDVGLRLDKHAEDWRLESGQLWFATVVEDQLETVYGVRAPDEEILAALDTRPQIAASMSLPEGSGGQSTHGGY